MPERDVYDEAAAVMASGGVIAYPTEGVFGLGCLPNNEQAAKRILDVKQRGPESGFILVAANLDQLLPFIAANQCELLRHRVVQSGSPVTWVVDASDRAPTWVTGGRDSVAVRISEHPVVRGLCLAANSALISTSANRSGQPPAIHPGVVQSEFGEEVDLIVPGEIGGLDGATEIRLASDNTVLRAAAARRDMP